MYKAPHITVFMSYSLRERVQLFYGSDEENIWKSQIVFLFGVYIFNFLYFIYKLIIKNICNSASVTFFNAAFQLEINASNLVYL